MNRDELLEQLTEDILAYVMHGVFPEQHVAQELAPSELDERFHEYEMLVRLHFVLRPDVVDFVEELPHHLRNIKTQTENVSETNRGTVDGRINWSETIRERFSRNPHDRSLFVCENRTENYDIDENVVLKRLLALIHGTLEECEPYLEQDYQWVNERWKGERDLVETMRETFKRNVHVTRIRDPEEYEPTDRMVQRASESRQEVYREAARLLNRYRETIRGDRDAVAELLEQTAITPDDDETLFELFVLFRYIGVIEQIAGGQFELKTIKSGKQEVARLEHEDRSIVLYHDSAARARDLKFVSDVTDKDPDELSRTELVQYETGRLVDEYFREETTEVRSGRPDVIVLEIQGGETSEYLITEVKYSSQMETIQRGVKETLEYLAFLRETGDGEDRLVHGEDNVFGDGWNGVLVVKDIEGTETASVEEQRLMRILQASELETDLGNVIRRMLN